MRRAIHRFKYLGEVQRGRDLGHRLFNRLPDLRFERDDIDVFVPVPLHPRRSRQRGFNQAKILADVLGKRLERPSVEAVRRVRNTPSQTSLNEIERARNVVGAFEPVSDECARIEGCRVVIIDDVATTGATISEVAQVIADMGAESIDALVVAREQ